MAHEQASMEKSETVYPKSFSCGIVTVPKRHGEVDVNDISRRADEAMYCQKKSAAISVRTASFEHEKNNDCWEK